MEERELPREKDAPTILHPVVREIEQEAIRRYRAKYPDGPDWNDLDRSTNVMWVAYTERNRGG